MNRNLYRPIPGQDILKQKTPNFLHNKFSIHPSQISMTDYIFQRRLHLQFYILFYHVTLTLPHEELVQFPCNCVQWASTNRPHGSNPVNFQGYYHKSNISLFCLLVTKNTHVWSPTISCKKSNNPEVAKLWGSQANEEALCKISNTSIRIILTQGSDMWVNKP